MATAKPEGNVFPFWDIYAAGCSGAAEHERGVFMDNQAHVVSGVEGPLLVLTSADPSELRSVVSRDDLGQSLRALPNESLVALGMRVVLRNGKWEVATLRQ